MDVKGHERMAYHLERLPVGKLHQTDGAILPHQLGLTGVEKLSARVYSAAGKEVDFVRQSDIDKVRYPELIMKLARQQGGRVATKDVMSLLHLGRKQAYRQLKKLESEGALELKKLGAYSYYAVVD